MSVASVQHFTAAASSAVRARTRPQPTILIAEDSADSREMLATLLALKGYEVLSADNGVQAIEVALADLPDLILMDLQMPKVDGLNVARNLRHYAQFRDVPIIIFSGHDPAKHRQAALDAGCTDYLLKPIDFDRLDKILRDKLPLSG